MTGPGMYLGQRFIASANMLPVDVVAAVKFCVKGTLKLSRPKMK